MVIGVEFSPPCGRKSLRQSPVKTHSSPIPRTRMFMLYGHREFVTLIGATESAALEMLDSIKTELEVNEKLAEDFPEVCFPIGQLEGIANRCAGQLYLGERTRITWTSNEIVLPTIAGGRASGIIVRVAGITGRVRGMKYKRADGRSVRPSLVIIDDPQTSESAGSLEQTRKRVRVLAGDILGLAGPGQKISGIMPCTIIRPGDMRNDLEKNRDSLQSQLNALKKTALDGEANFEEIRKAGERLVEVKQQLRPLREPVSEEEVIAALSDMAGLWNFLFPGARRELLRLVLRSIEIFEDRISLTLNPDGLGELTSEMSQTGYFAMEHENAREELPEIAQEALPDGALKLTMRLAAKKVDGHRCVMIPAPGAERPRQSAVLRAIHNAQRWSEMLIEGEVKSISELAARLKKKPPYVTRILRLNNLAPDIIEAIYRGDEPEGLSLARLEKGFPDDWQDQRREFGFAALQHLSSIRN